MKRSYGTKVYFISYSTHESSLRDELGQRVLSLFFVQQKRVVAKNISLDQ